MEKPATLPLFALLLLAATAVLAGCQSPAPVHQAAAPTEPAPQVIDVPAAGDSSLSPKTVPPTAAIALPEKAGSGITHSATNRQGALAPSVQPGNAPSSPTPAPPDDGLEFLSTDSVVASARDGGIEGAGNKSTQKGGPTPGPGQGQAYTWEDGDRTLTAYLQAGLVAEKGSDGSLGEVVDAAEGGGNVVRSADAQSKGNTLPVFRSESGELLTLPGGVLLVLNAEWTQAEINTFFSSNGIEMDRVSELSYAVNGFFVETEPGFPSLDLANELAAKVGVELSSPNWGRETVPK